MHDILKITPQGGCTFSVRLDGDNTNPQTGYLGRFEFGSIGDDGQYEQGDSEIVKAARAEFDIDDSIKAIISC
jgi:hypothetical protein